MSDLISRKSRICNDCPEEIRLKVLEYPGPFLHKEITIPPGGHKDISFQTVDNSYNQGRSKSIHILRQGQREYEKEYISFYDIRDCKKLKLTLIDDDDEKGNKKKVHVHRIEGNFFLRIGISWMLKDLVWKFKKSVRSNSKSVKKLEGEKLMENCITTGEV